MYGGLSGNRAAEQKGIRQEAEKKNHSIGMAGKKRGETAAARPECALDIFLMLVLFLSISST